MFRDEIFRKYRMLLIKSYVFIAFIIILLEIAIYFGMLAADIKSTFFDSYFIFYMLFPAIINAAAISVTALIHSSGKFSAYAKNSAVIFGLEIMCLNVSCIHSYWAAVPCCFCIPVIVSSLFGRKKLTLSSAALSTVFLFISSVVASFFDRSDSTRLWFNSSISLIMIIISYVVSLILIRFEQETSRELESRITCMDNLQKQLQRDQMTGLFNHTEFYKRLDKAISSAKDGTPLSLAVIDLDNFKRVNDRCGHENGNVVLLNLARIMEKYCEATDMICRYGGEEFAIIFNGREISKSFEIIKNILKHFNSVNFDFMPERMSFSCGLCEYKKDCSSQEFFNRADKAMYIAKKNGKNQCCTIE